MEYRCRSTRVSFSLLDFDSKQSAVLQKTALCSSSTYFHILSSKVNTKSNAWLAISTYNTNITDGAIWFCHVRPEARRDLSKGVLKCLLDALLSFRGNKNKNFGCRRSPR
jgi:hypothetical protein